MQKIYVWEKKWVCTCHRYSRKTFDTAVECTTDAEHHAKEHLFKGGVQVIDTRFMDGGKNREILNAAFMMLEELA